MARSERASLATILLFEWGHDGQRALTRSELLHLFQRYAAQERLTLWHHTYTLIHLDHYGAQTRQRLEPLLGDPAHPQSRWNKENAYYDKVVKKLKALIDQAS